MADVIAEVKAEVSKFKAFENKVFAFLQAHYVKALAVVTGYLASHLGLVSWIVTKIL